MNEVEFKKWMQKNGTNKKVAADCISRLKRIEKEIDHCDLDREYHSDRCAYILGVFEYMGKNDKMAQYPNANFPIGKYSMNAYRYAINKYIAFCNQTISIRK